MNKPNLAELFEAHWAVVYRECARILDNPAMAEDAAAETFLRAWRAFESFSPESSLGWLLTIARHVCINMIRKAAASREIACDEIPEPEGSVESNDVILLLQRLPAMIKSLQDERRVAIKLYLHGHSYAEMAEIMRCPKSEVKTHLQTAFRQLRNLWEQGKAPGA